MGQTIPMIARELGASLDTIRAQVRRSPDLHRLGRKVGGVRFYDPTEVERIRAAFEASRAGRLAKEVAVA